MFSDEETPYDIVEVLPPRVGDEIISYVDTELIVVSDGNGQLGVKRKNGSLEFDVYISCVNSSIKKLIHSTEQQPEPTCDLKPGMVVELRCGIHWWTKDGINYL